MAKFWFARHLMSVRLKKQIFTLLKYSAKVHLVKYVENKSFSNRRKRISIQRIVSGCTSWTERNNGWIVCNKNTEEGHDRSRWRFGMYHDWKTCVIVTWQTAISSSVTFLFSIRSKANRTEGFSKITSRLSLGSIVLCHGICKWWWSDVSNTTWRKI